MRQIEDPASEALTVLQALESLARLAWNDDDVREQVAQMDGMHHATCMIRQHAVRAESIRICSHKAEIPQSRNRACFLAALGCKRDICACMGRDSDVRCMQRGTCN